MEEVREEEWRYVHGYKGWYDISSFGRVMRVKKVTSTFNGKILNPGGSTGYKNVSLYKNGKRKYALVHRLVMQSFVGQCPEGNVVNHKDGNKTNNKLDNLEYITPSENVLHAFAIGLRNNRGESQYLSKLTEDDVCEIRERLDKETQKSIADSFNVNKSTIGNIARGKTWGWLK